VWIALLFSVFFFGPSKNWNLEMGLFLSNVFSCTIHIYFHIDEAKNSIVGRKKCFSVFLFIFSRTIVAGDSYCSFITVVVFYSYHIALTSCIRSSRHIKTTLRAANEHIRFNQRLPNNTTFSYLDIFRRTTRLQPAKYTSRNSWSTHKKRPMFKIKLRAENNCKCSPARKIDQ